jgi:peptidoglycan/LPS O-acetylase OafA/YrhL
VLSGRLMGEILFVQKAPLPRFFARRFSRVYPALACFVLVTTLSSQGTQLAHGTTAAILALTFTINYGMVLTHQVALLDHLWSLSVEEHAYMILAGLALLTGRRSTSGAWLMAAMGTLAAVNAVVSRELLGQTLQQTHWRTDVAACGVFLSASLWLVFRHRKVWPWAGPICAAIAVVCKFADHEAVQFGLSNLALAVAITTIDRAPKLFRSALSAGWLRRIGLYSFSMYLWQQPFYKMFRAGAAPAPILLCGAAICALLSFYLVENPSRRALNLLFDRWLKTRSPRLSSQGQT